MYSCYAGNFPQTGHGSCFPDEPVPVVLIRLIQIYVGIDYHQRPGMFPVNQAIGIVFLNGNRNLQVHVPANIGNAKAALAQDFTYHILIPENGTQGQLMGQIVCLLVEAAVFTDRIILF